MSNVVIKTAESEVKLDKNGRKYKTVSFGEVKPYDITAADGSVRTVNTYTTVVFSDTDSPAHESAVKAAFASKGHEIMTNDVNVDKTASALEALRSSIAG